MIINIQYKVRHWRTFLLDIIIWNDIWKYKALFIFCRIDYENKNCSNSNNGNACFTIHCERTRTRLYNK